MASLKMIMAAELRPCLVNCNSPRGGITYEKTALFHGFFQEARVLPPSLLKGGHNGGQVSVAVALVEYEDGIVATVGAERIRFLDSPGNFKEYDWTDPADQEEQEAEA